MGAIQRFVLHDRFVNNGMMALLGAFIVTLGLDIAIDADWLGDLFYLVFFAGLLLFYRGNFAPRQPMGMVLKVLALLLVAAVLALALLRVGGLAASAVS